MVDDTKDGVNDVNTLRILAPSGDHFMMNTAGLTTIGDLKATVYNTWPKGMFRPYAHHFHNKHFYRTRQRREA